jgi:hypothetical protein
MNASCIRGLFSAVHVASKTGKHRKNLVTLVARPKALEKITSQPNVQKICVSNPFLKYTARFNIHDYEKQIIELHLFKLICRCYVK